MKYATKNMPQTITKTWSSCASAYYVAILTRVVLRRLEKFGLNGW